jgi:hypothetical protein
MQIRMYFNRPFAPLLLASILRRQNHLRKGVGWIAINIEKAAAIDPRRSPGIE